MPEAPYLPVLETTRGQTVESIHYGAVVVVDNAGKMIAHYGSPQGVVFLRSTAKPFQALPFIEAGGHEHFDLTPKEIALMCASHSGTDEHVETALGIQQKAGITEDDLQCGIHDPTHAGTRKAMRKRGEEVTPNRNNCSGKHSGMLAHAKFKNLPIENYLDTQHGVQQSITQTFAEMCDLTPDDVKLGIDGCSAPNFAVPLYNAALAWARLADPTGLSEERAAACRTITSAMTTHPDMVGGPDRFDTDLMTAAGGKIVCKGGAEGYEGIGVMPGAMGEGSPALGIVLKISDGDPRGRAGGAVVVETLRQLGTLDDATAQAMKTYGPTGTITNHRKIEVGQKYPVFELIKS